MVTVNQKQFEVKIEQLMRLKNHFGEPFVSMKIQLLNQIAAINITTIPANIKYHDCLLFLIAYPENKTLFELALTGLNSINQVLKNKHFIYSHKEEKQLFLSGLSYSKMICSFSFDLVKWLYKQYPNQVEFYSCDASLHKQQEVLRLLMPTAQHPLVSEGNVLPFTKWLSLSVNNQSHNYLTFLISRFDAIADDAFRDMLYASLSIFVSITLNEKMFSRTSGVVVPCNVFYQKEIIKNSTVDLIFRNELLQSKLLKPKEKEHLIAVARMSLCCLQRETDPVTYAEPKATEYYELQRGVSIALFTMQASRRLTLESYIGYMAFKNGVPIAYGGGWIYNLQAKIGINVYEPFRGGESAFIFGEVMHLYAARFKVKCFVAEPYQIGKQNNDGIKSGAFWFYYKFGFRPIQKELMTLASKEFEKLIKNKKYRTPAATLRKLAKSNMQLAKNSNDTATYLDVSKLSLAHLKNEAIQFDNGNLNPEKTTFDFLLKTLSIKDFNSWSLEEQHSFKQLSSLVFLIKELPQWNKKDKSSLVKLIRSKGSQSESAFIKMVQHHKKLTDGLLKIAL